jgi:hypothetical protein
MWESYQFTDDYKAWQMIADEWAKFLRETAMAPLVQYNVVFSSFVNDESWEINRKYLWEHIVLIHICLIFSIDHVKTTKRIDRLFIVQYV